MTRFIKYLTCTLLAVCLTTQYSFAQYKKIIVQLANKANSNYSLNNPGSFLSPRSLQRRIKRQIAIDSTDLPVPQNYIDQIVNTGQVKFLSASKWLNQVLVETTDDNALTAINKLSFVIATRPVGNRAPLRTISKDVADTFRTFVENARQTGAADFYNYGSNYQQVHIHNGEFLHNKGYQGQNMMVALLDAGFGAFKSISAFDSIRLNDQVLGEKDFVAYDSSVNEDDTHGMQCLSTMAANWPGQMVGTAPKAGFWLIRTENAATEFPVEEFNWVVGAEFADSVGCDLISSSLGYSQFDDPTFDHSYNDLYKSTTTVSRGARLAVAKGMIVMNSAGNEGNSPWKYIIFPADADSVCTVGATTATGNIAGFSSVGYPGKIKPNVVSVGAPAIVAGFNDRPVSAYGTSFANPNLAGLVTCLWQAFPWASNMKILDAVYRSSDRYSNPDDHYGYGLPDFKTAYQLLKHEENVTTFGNDYLFATPNPFFDQVNVVVISRADGEARADLLNDQGKIINSKLLLTEKEEVYRFSFSNLVSIPAGNYSIRYSDSLGVRTLPLQKGNFLDKDWLIPLPNPFKTAFTVYLKAPETGEVRLRLLDTKGSIVETITTEVMQGQPAFVHFNNIPSNQTGTYFLQYLGKTHKRTIRVLKN